MLEAAKQYVERFRARTVYYSSRFGGGTAIELSGNNFESSFVGAVNEQLTISIFAPRIF